MATKSGRGNAALHFIRNLEHSNRRKKQPAKLSRTRQPNGMAVEDWQRELRKQFGRNQKFRLENIGHESIFSEYIVSNPQSGNSYRVNLRGIGPGDNHCTCGDFQTNLLGTCKHIEFVLGRMERRPGGKAALANGFQPTYSEVCLHYGLQREVRFRAGADCPPEFARFASEFFGADGCLNEGGFARFEQLAAKAAESAHELRTSDDVLQYVAERRDAARRRERLTKLFPKGIHSASFKSLVDIPLYEYQRSGALFAAQAGRALIGDEMGLGKTVQAIAAAEIMARAFGVERVLIVCPTSLKHQWEREIARFSRRSATVVAGFRRDRQLAYAAPSFFKIVNYDSIHCDLDLVADWRPDLVVLDEAQRIKNWETRAAKAVKKIASPYAIVLTGTPLENRLEELVSIVQFIDKHRLGPTYRFLHDHQCRDGFGRVIGYKDLDRISTTLQPILLRRKKSEVLGELPARLDKCLFFAMSPLQRRQHDESKDEVARIVAKWRRLGLLSEVDRRRLMIGLQTMRMACDNSYLVDKQTDSGPKADELATLLAEVLEDHTAKVVVFSQWTAMHEMAIRRLRAGGIGHVHFHGGVESRKRQELIDRFRVDPECRVFLATDAGGVGLNLQFANVVVNLDMPWNPAVLEQRVGRVHRLGQTKPVQVFHFVSKATIEERMLEVLKFKKAMLAGVLDGGEKQVMLGGGRLKKFMESIDDLTGKIPAAVAEPAPASDDWRVEKSSRRGTGAARLRARTKTEANEVPTEEPSANSIYNQAAMHDWLQLGLELLSGLHSTSEGATASPVRRCIDESTGEAYLRLPAPSQATLEQVIDAVGRLLKSLRHE